MKSRKVIVELVPPGSTYSDLAPGSIYRILRESEPKWDRNCIWIKAPPEKATQAGRGVYCGNGDFVIRGGIVYGQYVGNRPAGDEIVEFLGVLHFDVGQE